MDHLYKELEGLKGEERLKKLKELEDLFGTKKLSHFGTYHREIFEENLKEMNLSEMRQMAAKVGVNPNLERIKLKEQLRKAFEMDSRDKKGLITPSPSPVLDVNKIKSDPKSKEALEFMGEI